MADVLHLIESQNVDDEVENGEMITRVFQVRHGVTLSSANQERGDIVSGTTYYEIVRSSLNHVKGRMQQWMRVRGFRSDLWTGVGRSDTFRELLNSRVEEKSRNGIRYTRRWECDDSVIEEGEKGWSAVTDSTGTYSQALFVVTWVSGSLFYPAMIGLPLDFATSADSIVAGYTDTKHLTVLDSATKANQVMTFRGKLPAEIGDAYGSGSWTNQIEPACINVSINPNYTVKRSLITAQYSAARRR